MLRRIVAIFGMVCLLALMGATPALAGGWANVTLDRLPTDLQAGQTATIGFMVRQHGVTPTNFVQPYLSARHLESGRTAYFPARQEGPVGHFVADVTFPTAGVWEWEAVPDPFPPTKLGTLTVLPAAAAPPRPAGASQALVTIAITPQVALRVVGAAFVLVALALALVSRRGAAGVPGRLRPLRSR
jgi:hypothetical protein